MKGTQAVGSGVVSAAESVGSGRCSVHTTLNSKGPSFSLKLPMPSAPFQNRTNEVLNMYKINV